MWVIIESEKFWPLHLKGIQVLETALSRANVLIVILYN
jgi:nicotinamide mononucleotide adenylyltransferase